MHRVIAYDEFGWKRTIGEYEGYWFAVMVAMVYQLFTGDVVDVHPDI